jgi:hypothetical protein
MDGVSEGLSQFGHTEAFWVNGMEIGHIEGRGIFEVRLTRALIRDMRPMLKANDAIRLRRGTSDWLEVVVASADDADLAVSLFEHAVAAHRPTDGSPERPPPTDDDVRGRRRLH